MTAEQLEKKEMNDLENLLKKDDLTEEQKNAIAAQKMKKIISKIINEK